MEQTQHFSTADLELFSQKGISITQVLEQLECFQRGFPYLTLHGFASINNGVIVLSDDQCNHYIDRWQEFLNSDTTIQKFVPASGAASRMFKDLFEYLDTPDAPSNSFIDQFFEEIDRFAFRSALDKCCQESYGSSLNDCIAKGEKREIIDLLLRKGLKYGNLPKGVLEFHQYKENHSRTPLEEHLVEGALYAKDRNGNVNIHFTVSEEFLPEFKALIEKQITFYETHFAVHYNVTFSFQKPSTDTVAVDSNNTAFREQSGEVVFRPGGHGALIENLNDLPADIVFIKNIDNIVPDHYKKDTITYKKVIAGLLIETRQRVFDYIQKLHTASLPTPKLIAEIAEFVKSDLYIQLPESFSKMELNQQASLLIKKLNRPMRVCGVVKNSGEPGGGPYWVVNKDQTISLQILESSQIDLKDDTSSELLKSSTHFNPVDLVCSLKDYLGQKFDLKQFVDPQTGFISSKSKAGKQLKALELPGLWNGAMSDWITLLVEVPSSTFNPVKTVNDLLRPEHQ